MEAEKKEAAERFVDELAALVAARLRAQGIMSAGDDLRRRCEESAKRLDGAARQVQGAIAVAERELTTARRLLIDVEGVECEIEALGVMRTPSWPATGRPR